MKHISVLFLLIFLSASAYAQTVNDTTRTTAQSLTDRNLIETAKDSLGNAEDYSFLDSIKVSIVRGELPQVKLVDGGALSVDLPEIVKDRPVTNIYDALAYVPGVSKSTSGDLSLIGAGGFAILINGKLPTMPSENLVDLLKSYPVDKLKNVEVYYSAPAKYHVNGAAINIILKESSALDGLQGQVKGEYDWSHYSSGGAGIAGSYAGRKWSADLVYNFRGGKDWQSESIRSDHTLSDGANELVETLEQTTSKNYNHNGHVGLNFDLGRNNSLSASYDFQFKPVDGSNSISDGTLGTYRTTTSPRSSQFHSASLDYTSSFGLSLGFAYTNYHEHAATTLTDITDPASTEELQDYTSEQHVTRYHVYADQAHHIGKWELNYGASFDYSHDFSAQYFGNWSSDDFANILREYFADFYVGFATSFDCGISLSASVKGDYYKRGDDKKFWAAPRISFSYMKNQDHIFQINVSNAETYPSYWATQSTKTWLNNYMLIEGNPLLKPSYNTTSQVAYILKQKYMAVIYYSYIDGYWQQLPYQSPDEFNLIYKVHNFDWQQQLGLMLRAPWRIGDVWNSTVTLNGFYTTLKIGDFYGLEVHRRKVSFMADWDNSIKLSRSHPIYLTVDATVLTPTLQGIMDIGAVWKIDAGFKWTFLKGAADLVVSGIDLANTWSPLLKSTRYDQNYRMQIIDMTRTVSVSFVYRFHGFQPKNYNVDSSRFGTGK